jgi:hypothetical protein
MPSMACPEFGGTTLESVPAIRVGVTEPLKSTPTERSGF